MHYLRVVILSILTGLSIYSPAFADDDAGNSLSGSVTDKLNNTPLPGVTVYFPDLHVGAATNAQGHYEIRNLPKGKILVEVHFIGYATLTQTVQVNGATNINFSLSTKVIEENEVVITGVSQATSLKLNPTPVNIIRRDYLDANISTNIIDAVAKLPGVSQLTTGPAISKPFIRGLGYNRVVVIGDGIRQEGQQWGDEHGIEIDDYNVSKVEVLKGPASLVYGSDALAGVVNIVPPGPEPAGHVKGNIAANYLSNNGMISYHADLAGTTQNGFSWSVYGTQKFAHDYKNKYDGYVYNSKFHNTNYGGSIGINKNWGSSVLRFTSFNQELGLVEGDRNELGQFIKPVNNNGVADEAVATDKDAKSYTIGLPRQQINHQKLVWDNNFYMHNGGRLNVILGYQWNRRQEFGDVLNPNKPELYLKLNTFNYGVKYSFADMNGWQTGIGVNGMQQHNDILSGSEFLVPGYNLFDAGLYAVTSKTWDKLTLSGGLRFDNRHISVQGLMLDGDGKPVSGGGEEKFNALSKNFSNISGSAGLSYAASDRVTLKANVARGFRAPNISEIGANGVHEGTIKYEYGNSSLKPEVSTQGDVGVELNSEHVSMTGSLFYNHITNFIYSRKLSSVNGGDSIPATDNDQGYAAFRYQQSTANLYGGEVMIDIHPHPVDWLHFENTFSYVKAVIANSSDSTKYLPNIPAARWLSELKGKFRHVGGIFQHAYVGIQMDWTFDQNNVYYAYQTETATPGYTLWNAGIGADVVNKNKRVLFSLHLAANNITDVAYQNHLSRLKYAAENEVTGRVGVFNMGRNYSVKVTIPLDFK
ncbi:TonB-dependent receptor [Chitinophaga sancti]|uniref:Iron complex outermembrane recepter protein n=1 Tax=Chitinophaga sancti TaxID=1004 RepID=A0A1K1PFC9_9BACT|nr:TonB-dependent receptor [Chitinophaga sancti]WQD65864.1 TonB-dependent receptor [Chitinophaga sancti]WQG88514.1 TonB-dependent receptor [Chitinophaga sancti]SFW46480.1 iron complex outermembrane recepter protein [Chitinophaga sancti]